MTKIKYNIYEKIGIIITATALVIWMILWFVFDIRSVLIICAIPIVTLISLLIREVGTRREKNKTKNL